jgi:hypothetical protein
MQNYMLGLRLERSSLGHNASFYLRESDGWNDLKEAC